MIPQLETAEQGILLLSLLQCPHPHCFLLFHPANPSCSTTVLPGVLKTNVSAVTLAAASTFPGLLLHLWEGLIPDTCLGMRRVGERNITINWQALPVAGMAYAAQSLHTSLLSKACQQTKRKMGHQTPALATFILHTRKPSNGGTKAHPGFQLWSPYFHVVLFHYDTLLPEKSQ